jgi:hypothetical protein
MMGYREKQVILSSMHYRMGLKANAIQIHVISGIAK